MKAMVCAEHVSKSKGGEEILIGQAPREDSNRSMESDRSIMSIRRGLMIIERALWPQSAESG
jgi:hypothetical protein